MFSLQKKSLIIISLVICLLLGTNIYTYKISSKNTKFDSFLFERVFDFKLLESLDENKTEEIESVLMGNIGLLFFEAGITNDINKFLPICKYLTVENVQLYNKYNSTNRSLDPKYEELYKVKKLGGKKLIELCNL